jgi:adenylate cyclase
VPPEDLPKDVFERALESIAEGTISQDRKYTANELARLSGVDLGLARRLRRAMGLPDLPEDEAGYSEDDLRALERAKKLMDEDGLTASQILQLARTLGLAAARMADAVVGFWTDRLVAGVAGGGSPEEFLPDAKRVDDLQLVVDYLLRRHLVDSISRRVGDASDIESGHLVAVGFADLVGFTSLSEQLSDTETADLIDRFERVGTDTVVGGGGRVVKMIGDEVMFTAEPSLVAEIALCLSETFDSPDLPSVRVGVAMGTVVSQFGDLYGPVVNLASRATMAARPGSVLISPSLAEVLGADKRYSVKTIRPHKLKGIGTVQLSILRRAGDNRRS